MPSTKRKRAGTKHEPPGLTRARVCAEALALVDDEGLDALSMRKLGARLGVEAMSLYRHVRDKADLLDALHAAVLAELRSPEAGTGVAPRPAVMTDGPDDWRILLGGLAHALRTTLLRHPNVIPLFATRPVRAPEAMVLVVGAWGALERAGFTMEDARKAIIAVGVYTIGHVLGEAHGEPAPHLGAPERPGPAEFDFGVGLLLDGLAMRRPAVAR